MRPRPQHKEQPVVIPLPMMMMTRRLPNGLFESTIQGAERMGMSVCSADPKNHWELLEVGLNKLIENNDATMFPLRKA